MKYLLSGLLAFLLLSCIAGCSASGNPPALETYQLQDICSSPPFLEYDLAAASQAPFLPELAPETPPSLGLLGSEGASELAMSLIPSGTFCSLAVSDAAAAEISRALQLIQRGRSDQARTVLKEWLSGQGSILGARLAAPAWAGSDSRQQIRDLLNAAAADVLAGGDGSTYLAEANQTFRDMFAGEISDAGFGDSMRLAEEAGLLGENELYDTAVNRAKRIWEEKLQADLEDFDPCSATREEVRDLLNSLAQAMLLGIEGAYEDTGQYYQAVKAKAQAAAQQLHNQLAIEKGFPELSSPVPECTPGGDIEVRQLLPFAKEPCIDAVPFTLTWQGNTATLKGNGSTECTHVEENLGGSPVAIHEITRMELVFSGTASSGSPGRLKVSLAISGEIIEFYSNFPPESPQIFTEDHPFQVAADSTYELNFDFREGARAEIANTATGEAALVFILHLEQP